MFLNWCGRFVQKSLFPSSRRTHGTSQRVITILESRVLLAAKIGTSPKVDPLAAASGAARGADSAPLFPLSETFKLHSRPSATKVLYIDFNGQQVKDTAWNSNGNTLNFEAYSYEGDASFSDNELESLQRIWARVVEDFAPFDIDVTTEEPPIEDLRKTGGSDTRWGIRALVSNNDPLNTGAGGVAYIGSFNWDSDTPALIFNGTGEKVVGETISHEVGHSLFLGHHGRTTPKEEYYFGHGSGDTSWGPIMGAGYSVNLSQWSQGEYKDASNQQDDLGLITTRNGFGYRPDDAANGAAGAQKITATKSGKTYNVNQKGVIEKRSDFDFYRIDAGNGSITLDVKGGLVDSNLDILLEVYDSNGNLVASSNPDDKITASVSFTSTLGAYFVKIDGVGKGDPKGTGYTDYGSLGQYHITGTYSDPENSPPVINDQSLPAVRENSPIGTIVGDVVAIDPNDEQTLKYSIIAGNTGGAFAIDANTGRITVANPSALDWEVNQVFKLTVQVTDNGVPPRSDTGIVTIEVLDVTTYSFNNGVLTVKGTRFNDKINVYDNGGVVQIDDGLLVMDTGIASSNVTTINLLGLAGQDWLRLDSSLGTDKTSSILGGTGHDTMLGSLGKDTLDGGDGIDEVSYLQATSGVSASLLLTGEQNTGGSGLDKLVAVENLSGSNFADSLTGNALANVLNGGQGNDTLTGGQGDDRLEGGQGADELLGGDHNDTLVFDTADTQVSGSSGVDTATLVNPTAAVNLSLLPGQIEIVEAQTSTFNNKFDATGAAWSVTIIGGGGKDTIIGGGSADRLTGGTGDDSITGGGGMDTVDGGHGNDRLFFDNLDTSLIGGPGHDVAFLTGATGGASVNLGAGLLEEVDATASTFGNTLNASDAAWNVIIHGGTGQDTITGGSAMDTLFGGGGNDVIAGGKGTDSIEGGAGADSLDGGEGNDYLAIDNLDTSISGGNGTDQAKVIGATGAVNLNLFTAKLETVDASTSRYANTLNATGATWVINIVGGRGNDTITGGNRNDKLSGGAGNDSITGGLGNDVLKGDAGIDTVSYSTATSKVDVNLLTGRATGGAGTDSLFTFENITGSNFGDNLTGNASSNIIHGGLGVDTIIGGGGVDTILQD